MYFDAFLVAANNLAEILIPILLAVALGYLIYLLYLLSNFARQFGESVKDINKTVNLVNQSLDKVQSPLQTVENLSHTVDKIHESGIMAFKNMGDMAMSNLGVFKEYIKNGKEQ